jgi:hypothetical protein
VKLTRRHARALAAGAATTAAYLAAGRASGSRPVRVSGLLLLATVATASVQASAVAKTTKKRLDIHIGATAAAVHFVAQNSSVLTTLANASDPSFLAGMIGPIGHQTTANANIGATGASWTTAERTAVNGAINALNILQQDLQNANIES